MKISYNWLKNYLDFDLSVDELAEILTDTGLEVEGIKRIDQVKGGLEGLVIGKVIDCVKHEDADRLKITQVDIGTETLQIVCGADNVDANQKVVVATVGSTLYPTPDSPFKIKKAKIRGEASFGMICAEDEIGMGDSHEGIMVLPDDAVVGQMASIHFNLSFDYQLEIGLTPNRCDAMGHIGVARDLKAYLNYHTNGNKEIKLPGIDLPSVKNNIADFSIEITDSELCSRYIGAVIEDVNVEPSPEWMQKVLRTIDIEPINNIVDVTNYVMFEFGTPLHAFDYTKIGNKICVQQSKKGESFTTLDGVERKLNGEELMITNGQENLCIAGVYGGLSSGISNDTTSIFIESAVFNPTSIRKTSKSHGLQTDASFRFERGVDTSFTEAAINRAISLILEISGGKMTLQPTKVDYTEHKPLNLELNVPMLNDRLGIHLEIDQVILILENLDFECHQVDVKKINIKVPEYRRDVYRVEDVMEEVLRIYGFNQVPIPKKWHISFQNKEYDNSNEIQRTLSNWFVSNGFNEVVNNSLSNDLFENKLDKSSGNTKVSILNPLSSELASMRRTLLFGLLENIKYNQNRQQNNLKFFEFGKIYEKSEKGFHETRQLAFVVTGNDRQQSWRTENKAMDFFDVKAICISLGEKLGLKLKEKNVESSMFFDSAQSLSHKKKVIFEYGSISQDLNNKIGFKGSVLAGILNIDHLLDHPKAATVYKELPKTFFVKRDFSLILDKSVSYASIQKIVKDSERNLLKDMNLFDVYEGKNLPEDKKSYAVSFIFQDPKETLQDAQIDKVMEKIRLKLKSELGAELRA